MSKELREQVKHIHQTAYGTVACQAVDESIALIRKATLDEVKDALNNLKRVKEKTMLGRPLHSEYIEAINKLGGK